MRIGWLTPGNDSFGTFRVTQVLTRELLKQGDQPVLLAIGEGDLVHKCRASGMEVMVLEAEEPPWIRRGSLCTMTGEYLRQKKIEKQTVEKLFTGARDLGLQALNFQHQNLVGLAGKTACRLQIPCFWQVPNALGTGYPLGLNRFLYKRQCRRYGITLLPNSRYTLESFGSLKDVSVKVVSLGIDPDEFNPEKVRKLDRNKYGMAPAAVVFGIFARMVPEKGQLEFLQALLQLDEQAHPWHLLLVGSSGDLAYRKKILDYAEKAGVLNRVSCMDATSDIRPYFTLIDVAVNPRLDGEPFGLFVVEAMAMQKPVLAHGLGGPSEIILEGTTGWLAPTASPDVYREMIFKIWAERERWQEMGRAGRRRVLEYYTVKKMCTVFGLAVQSRLRTDSSPT